MSTIFHKGRKVLRKAIGNHNFAEIADLLYFRITGSKYHDKEGKPFFLLPNINHIAEETGFCITLCKKSLSTLENNNWIKKIKIKCSDGAVRLKIFITDKFEKIMCYIESIAESTPKNFKEKNLEKIIIHNDSTQYDRSDKTQNDESYIKEDKKKEDNKCNNKTECLKNEDKEIITTVNFEFSLNLEQCTEKMDIFIKNTAKKEQVNPESLLITLVDLQESGLYENQKVLIKDAIQSLKRIDGKKNDLPEGDGNLKPQKATFKAEDKRMNYLTPLQQIAIIQNLKELKKTKRACLWSIEEIFSWIEYQITNPKYHFQGKGFKHCLNIIKKMLCNRSKKQYSRPYGYSKTFNSVNH